MFLLLRFHLNQRDLHCRDLRYILRDKKGSLDMSEINSVQNVECGAKASPESVCLAQARTREPKGLRVVFKLTQGTHVIFSSHRTGLHQPAGENRVKCTH